MTWRSSLFCYVTQRKWIVPKGTPKGCPETSVTTSLRCVTSQNSEDLGSDDFACIFKLLEYICSQHRYKFGQRCWRLAALYEYYHMDSPLQLSEYTQSHKFGASSGLSIFCSRWVATCMTYTVDLFKYVMLTDRRSVCLHLYFLSFYQSRPSSFLHTLLARNYSWYYINSLQKCFSDTSEAASLLSVSLCLLLSYSLKILPLTSVFRCCDAMLQFLSHNRYDAIYSCPVHSYVQEIQLYEGDSMDISWSPVSAGRIKWRMPQVTNFVVHPYQGSVTLYVLFMACLLLTLRLWYWLHGDTLSVDERSM